MLSSLLHLKLEGPPPPDRLSAPRNSRSKKPATGSPAPPAPRLSRLSGRSEPAAGAGPARANLHETATIAASPSVGRYRPRLGGHCSGHHAGGRQSGGLQGGRGRSTPRTVARAGAGPGPMGRGGPPAVTVHPKQSLEVPGV